MASNIVFDNAILLSHNVYKKGYGCKLNDLSVRDYNTGGFNDKIVSLDLDSYEKSVNPNSQNNTMDAAIGIRYHFDNIESEWYIEDLISDFKGVLLSANKLREMV